MRRSHHIRRGYHALKPILVHHNQEPILKQQFLNGAELHGWGGYFESFTTQTANAHIAAPALLKMAQPSLPKPPGPRHQAAEKDPACRQVTCQQTAALYVK